MACLDVVAKPYAPHSAAADDDVVEAQLVAEELGNALVFGDSNIP